MELGAEAPNSGAGPYHSTITLIVTLPQHPQEANYYGSLTQAGTVSLGLDTEGQEVFVPFHTLLPMVSPDDLVFDGGRSPGPRMGWEAVSGGDSCWMGLSLRVYPRLGHIVTEPG